MTPNPKRKLTSLPQKPSLLLTGNLTGPSIPSPPRRHTLLNTGQAIFYRQFKVDSSIILLTTILQNFGPPFPNNARPSSTSVNKLCHLRPPHTAHQYRYYLQLASPYLWTVYHSRLQWWPFDHHSTSNEQKTVTKLSPPHFTLFDPVISESSRLPQSLCTKV